MFFAAAAAATAGFTQFDVFGVPFHSSSARQLEIKCAVNYAILCFVKFAAFFSVFLFPFATIK